MRLTARRENHCAGSGFFPSGCKTFNRTDCETTSGSCPTGRQSG
jgi:hypothetical protein